MARWDSPLFVLPWDEEVPLEDIWLAVTKGEKKPPTNSAQHVSHHIIPSFRLGAPFAVRPSLRVFPPAFSKVGLSCN